MNAKRTSMLAEPKINGLKTVNSDARHQLRLALGHLETVLDLSDPKKEPVLYLSGEDVAITLRVESATGPDMATHWQALVSILKSYAEGKLYICAQTCPQDWESRVTPKCPILGEMLETMRKENQ